MRFPAPLAAPLLAAGLACAAGRGHAATLTVAVNHSVRLPVAGRAASVVLGNSAVADVTVVDSHTLFVTGKAPGSTDLQVVDPLGRTVYAADVDVALGAGRPVTIHRGTQTAELSCDPRCFSPTGQAGASEPAGAPVSGPALAGGMAGGMLGSAVGSALGGAVAAPAAAQSLLPARAG